MVNTDATTYAVMSEFAPDTLQTIRFQLAYTKLHKARHYAGFFVCINLKFD